MQINNTIFNCELSDIIAELQSQLSINGVDLIRKTRDSGNDIMVCCPYHNEHRPSAGIRKSDGQFHCFACQETHTLPEVISHCFGHTDDILGKFGWNWLLKNFATMQVEERKDVELDFGRNNYSKPNNIYNSCDSEHNSGHISERFVTEEELDTYRYIHPYMYKRRLTDEVIELFDIGYDKDSQCITFPVRDIRGNTLFIARRSVNTKFFNYPQGVEKPLYGLYELFKDSSTGLKNSKAHSLGVPYSFPREVIVCESMIDALTCWVYGRYAVALNGLGNELQFKQLRDLPCRKLILATDMDKRGLDARYRIRKNIPNKIITEYIWDLDKAKDINDMEYEMFENLEEIF